MIASKNWWWTIREAELSHEKRFGFGLCSYMVFLKKLNILERTFKTNFGKILDWLIDCLACVARFNKRPD